MHRPVIELPEIIGRIEQAVVPIAAQPADVFDDGIDVLGLFFGGVGIVEPKIAFAAELAREAEVEMDGFRVPDMQVAVRLRWKAGVHAAAVFIGLQVVQDDLPDEIRRACLGWSFCAGAGLIRSWMHGLFHSSIVHQLLQHLNRLLDAFEAGFAPQHFQRFKQRGSILAPAYGDANRLEHLPRLDFEPLGSAAQRRFQARMAEGRLSQNVARQRATR